MKILNRENLETIKILINEFIVAIPLPSKEYIPIELLKFLRKNNLKIEDGVLFNELFDLIESKIS